MEYNNTNDYWQHGYDPYKGMTDEECMTAGCLHSVCFIITFIVILSLCALLTGCTTTKYVTVPEVHERWHHSTDTIHETDSIIDRQTTIIRELDSAAMAKFGIRLQGLQRAWLVENSRLQRELSALRQTKTDTVIACDSVPVPYPVVKEVAARLSAWQKFRMHLGDILLIAGWVVIGLRIYRWLR